MLQGDKVGDSLVGESTVGVGGRARLVQTALRKTQYRRKNDGRKEAVSEKQPQDFTELVQPM